MLGKRTAPEKLINTMNRQKSSNVGTQVAGDRDPNCMSCDNLRGKHSITTHDRTESKTTPRQGGLAGRASTLHTSAGPRNEQRKPIITCLNYF